MLLGADDCGESSRSGNGSCQDQGLLAYAYELREAYLNKFPHGSRWEVTLETQTLWPDRTYTSDGDVDYHLMPAAELVRARGQFQLPPPRPAPTCGEIEDLLLFLDVATARMMIELKQPFGEHCAQDRKSMPPATFLERLLHEGVRLDAVGVQLLFGTGRLGRAARDIMQISSVLDEYFLLEIPVLISAMGVPSAVADEAGGYWRGPWSAAIQSKWVARMFSIAMSKPFVESVFWADLVDHRDADVPHSGLIDADGQAKPALARLLGMRRRLRKPLGPMRATEKSITHDEE